MAKFILGIKLGMSQVYSDDGLIIPVSVVGIDPNVVIGKKTKEKDGYSAMAVATGNKKKIKKPQKGQFKDLGNFSWVKEFTASDKEAEGEFEVGRKIEVSVFEIGDKVKVTGVSKGKGFAGAMKRHGFHGAPASHGHKSVKRRVGSIGQRFPQHTLKGLRMAGRMGGVKATSRGLTVIKVDNDNNWIAIKGAIPGHKGGKVIIQSQN